MPSLNAIQELKQRFHGAILVPGDPTYDTARKVWNGMIDRRPALIAQCSASSDVVSCIQFARTEGMPLSVRGGGHNYAGKAVCEGGLMIDLSHMKGIHVDPNRRVARAHTGLKLGEFDRETQRYGLVTPLGVATTTGISGLTLGGGYGWLVGKYGLSCDNVTWMEVATADGKLLECSAEHNTDLFWGMRGAGANFGVATQIEYRLHPVTTVYSGPIFYSLSADAMRFYAEFSHGIPDEMTTFAATTTLPDGTPAFAVVVCVCGSSAEGERLVEPLRKFGVPLIDLIQPRPYLELQSLFDADYPPGRRYYNKSHNIRYLTDSAIETVLYYASKAPPQRPSGIGFQQLHGVASRVSAGATAFPHRYDHDVVWINPVQDDSSEDETNLRWTRECWEALLPNVDQAVYVNTLEGILEDGEQRVRQAYGANYERLKVLKKRYDPTNLFSQNSNIRPD